MTVRKRPGIGDNSPKQQAIPRTAEQIDPSRREIVFWEERNPKALINLVSEKFQELLRELPPSLLSMNETELRKKLDPGWTHEQLRLAFWDEYFLTIDNNENKIRPAAVYARVCTKDYFYEIILNPLALAYIVRPPQDYIYQMRSLLNIGLERFAEILKLPLTNPNDTINTKLIGEIVKVVTILDNRVKGAVTQKIQIDGTQKNLNVNVNTYEAPKTHQDIDKELKDIEREIKALQSPQSGLNLFEGHDDGNEREPDVIEVSNSSAQT